MIESFLSVGTQVLILFLMIGTGFVLGKLHLITHKGAVSMSNLLMYVVSPCILIVVFQRPLETETFHNFWVALLAALVIALELGASTMILSGKLRWLGALALAAFTLMATFVALRFWELPVGQERFMAANSFFEHLGLIGGFLLVAWLDLQNSQRL